MAVMRTTLTALAALVVAAPLAAESVSEAEVEIEIEIGFEEQAGLGEEIEVEVEEAVETTPLPLLVIGSHSAPPGDVRGLESRPRVEPEDLLLALPRAVLFLPRLVVVAAFAPLRAGLRASQRAGFIPKASAALRWNEAETFGIRPVVSFLSSDGFSGGATLFHEDLLGHDEELHVSARFGGRHVQAYELGFEGERVGGGHLWLETLVRYESSPALLFAGVGDHELGCGAAVGANPSELGCETHYSEDRLLGLAVVGASFGPVGQRLKVGVATVLNDRTFGEASRSGRRSIGEVYDTAAVDGFDEDVTTLELDGSLVLDFMSAQGLYGTGVYLETFFGGTAPLNRYRYLHYGGELAGTIDLYRGTRLLTLRTAFEGTRPLRDYVVPFSELPRLGGPDRLRGYARDRFRDRLAALASVEYRYPIHAAVSGEFFADFGGVGRDTDALFGSPDAWNFGVGGGLVVGSADDIGFRFDVAYGEGAAVFISSELAHAFRNTRSEL
ncbi:MAG: hypothetical protein ACJAYU_005440 [Bradymonadia bacterium]|jgi:hypothetical protein